MTAAAIDRELINRAIFAGMGEKLWVVALYPSFPGGYNAEWEESWEELYGYDPDRARELLTEAGFPNGFEVRIKMFTLTGVPELPEVAEAMAAMWQNIGLTPKLEEIEFSRWREKYRAAETNCCVYTFRATASPTAIRVHFFYSPERFLRAYVTDSITEKRDRAFGTTDIDEANRLLQEIADEAYYNVGGVPLVALPVQAVIDPDVVKEYVFLGVVPGYYVSLEYIQAVRR